MGEILCQVNLAKAQVFCIYELAKIVIVDKNKDFVFATFYVIALGFEHFNNS